MKKQFITLCFLLISFVVFAGKFVLIPVTETNNLEILFNNNDLKIHYYSDDYVLATTDNLNFDGLVVLDENAFGDVGSYAKVYCFESQKETYLTRTAGSAKTLYSGENFFIMKIIGEGFQPAKNDGMIMIHNTEAGLPKNTFNYPVITELDEVVVNLISKLNTDTVMSYIQTLEDFGTRYCQHANHVAARNWIKQKYEEMGLDTVILHPFTWWGGTNHNVIAIQYGTDPILKDEYIVLGGHYDSYTYESQSNAPGADDDASGTAGVMETARVLSQYDFKRSIIYCAFSAEEMGLHGSGKYAQKCKNESMNILGYFNLDMTGYLKPGEPIHMSLIYPGGALTLADYFVNVCDIYFPDIPVTRHANLSWGDSDHTSFNQNGFKGIWWFEDTNCDSPYIHHIAGGTGCGNDPYYGQYCPGYENVPCLGDIIGPSVNSPEQVTVFTQAMVASIATLAIFDDGTPPLNPPKNCHAEHFEDMSIKVTWDAPEETTPDEYYIYRDNIKIAQQIELLYMDTVADYENHCYKVKAIYEEGESLFSNVSCASVPLPLIPPPTSCVATWIEEIGYGKDNVNITWDAPTENTPDEYLIYRKNIFYDEEEIIARTVDTYCVDWWGTDGHLCYKVQAIYGSYSSEFSNESCVIIPIIDGVTEYSSKYKIYPNPTTGELWIEVAGQARNDVKIENVEVFDVYGRKVSSHTAYRLPHTTLDISHLSAGIYFIKVITEKSVDTIKAVKL